MDDLVSFLQHVVRVFPVMAPAVETLAVEWATLHGKDPTRLIEALTPLTARGTEVEAWWRKYDSERPTKPNDD